jgi:hypothetical protein
VAGRVIATHAGPPDHVRWIAAMTKPLPEKLNQSARQSRPSRAIVRSHDHWHVLSTDPDFEDLLGRSDAILTTLACEGADQ